MGSCLGNFESFNRPQSSKIVSSEIVPKSWWGDSFLVLATLPSSHNLPIAYVFNPYIFLMNWHFYQHIICFFVTFFVTICFVWYWYSHSISFLVTLYIICYSNLAVLIFCVFGYRINPLIDSTDRIYLNQFLKNSFYQSLPFGWRV